jgi:hypothetical protein
MKYSIYKWFCVPLLFLFAGSAVSQNVKLDLTKYCNNSDNCNPFVNSYACSTAVLQTTHGSPAFYKPDTKTRQIQLEALITSNGVNYSEGFTVGYHFSPGKKYTVKITHKGMPSSTGGYLFPRLIAALTNKPPRFNDGCNLGYLETINIITQVDLTVSTTSKTSSFDLEPTEDIFNLWLRSFPAVSTQMGLLISVIEIVDHSVPPPPPPPSPSGCDRAEVFDFCNEKMNWVGSLGFSATKPITLACDVFTTDADPGPTFYRGFSSTEIILAPGFVASYYDYARFKPSFVATTSAYPCGTRLAVTDTTKPIKRNIEIDQQLPDNITIYPSPSNGMVKIACNNQELLHAAITVTDQSGRLVYEMRNKVKSNLVQLHLEYLSNGIYFIKVNTNNKVAIKKLLISK